VSISRQIVRNRANAREKEKTMLRRMPPQPWMQVPVSKEHYHQLLNASAGTSYDKEDWEIAAQAIDEWIRRHTPEALANTAHAGYQWKRLFLPAGTVLRTVYAGRNIHSQVEGDQIIYQGKPVSPTAFVDAGGGMRRNAWKSIWILFPHTTQWVLADTLRPPRTRA
jgi:hypothetical protein